MARCLRRCGRCRRVDLFITTSGTRATASRSRHRRQRSAPALMVRGDGGMVVAPPSLKSGVGRYRWIKRAPIAAMPPWLVDLTRERPPKIPIGTTPPIAASGAYGAAALKREIDALVNTAPGSRNHALNRASFSLHQLVAGGLLDGTEVERRLIEAAIASGLIADSGLELGFWRRLNRAPAPAFSIRGGDNDPAPLQWAGSSPATIFESIRSRRAKPKRATQALGYSELQTFSFCPRNF